MSGFLTSFFHSIWSNVFDSKALTKMNFPGPVFCSSYHEFVQSNGRVRGYKRRDLRSSSRKGGTRPKSVFPCREICQVWTQKGRPKKRDFLSSSKWGLAYLTYNEVVWPKVDEKISVAAMVDGFSGGISHKSRFVDRSNIPRKIGRPQFNGADKRVQTSGGLKNIRKEVKKIRRCTVGKVATNCVIVTSLHERSE